MSQTVVFLTSYTVNSKFVKGSFPVYVKGISQCCIDKNGYVTIQPITVKQK
jgi:hypothetical protein